MIKNNIDSIDSARGLAILLVFSFHIMVVIFPDYMHIQYGENGLIVIDSIKRFVFTFNPLSQGWVGVDLFLVISGFLIHLNKLRSASPFQFRVFISKRFWRIYPPYFILLVFFWIWNQDTSWKGILDFLSHAFMIHNLYDPTFFSTNPSYWSVALECQLYLIYPIYLYLVSRWGSKNSMILIVGIYFVLTLVGMVFHLTTNMAYVNSVFRYWFVWCAGAFLAEHFYEKKQLFNHPFAWFVASFCLFFAFKAFYIVTHFIYLPVTLMCVSLLETLLYQREVKKKSLQYAYAALSFIGMVSYGIYLMHQPFIPDLFFFFNPNTSYAYFNIFASVTLLVGANVLIAYLFYKGIEVRSIDFGRKMRQRTST